MLVWKEVGRVRKNKNKWVSLLYFISSGILSSFFFHPNIELPLPDTKKSKVIIKTYL